MRMLRMRPPLAAQVTEEQLAAAFQVCGQVVDCRVCGDPNSAMRFAFIEFYSEDGVHKARRPRWRWPTCPVSALGLKTSYVSPGGMLTEGAASRPSQP